ncbi:MAG: ABC transporter [Gammaproteobacteria bacterium]|nr:ABC transporter [Gammaproteobacteria bacterium]|tara:strand:- start:3977 stop:4720 length:744 start_codon:yes stop_codon:yes gene_type:complete
MRYQRHPFVSRNQLKSLIIASFLIISGCSTTANSKDDPFEPMNRAIFQFNEVVDENVFKPVAKGYKKVTPDPVEKGISNFFSNLGEVNTIANDVFQFKFKQAGYDFVRFSLNTTLGIVGIFDVATPLGFKKNNEDFGQTLGYWGIPQGPYLVLPFFGASSFRDGPGLYADMQMSPINQLDDEEALTLNALNAIDIRAKLLRATKILDTAAKDKYIFIRESYLQKREMMVNDGRETGDIEIDVQGVDY